jgi:6-phosphogluconolactonase (cycloisomerase 2 family)
MEDGGHFVYALGGGNSTLSVYRRLSSSGGALSLLEIVRTRFGPRSLVVMPGEAEKTYRSPYLYVLSREELMGDPPPSEPGEVYLYSVDSETALIGAPGSPETAMGIEPGCFALSPSGEHLYVPSPGGDEVLVRDVSLATGTLTAPLAPIATVAERAPVDVLLGGRDDIAYVLELGDPFGDPATLGALTRYDADPDTGALAFQDSVPTGLGPLRASIDPTGRFAYVANASETGAEDISVFELSAETGEPVHVSSATASDPDTGFTWEVAVHPTGRWAYASVALDPGRIVPFEIDPLDGSLTPLPAVGAGSQPRSLVHDPSGRFLYAAEYGSSTLRWYAVNPNSGALTQQGVEETPLLSGATGLAIDFSGTQLFVCYELSGVVAQYALDPVTGEPTPRISYPAGARPIQALPARLIE